MSRKIGIVGLVLLVSVAAPERPDARQPAGAPPPTPTEASSFRATPDYETTLKYLERLQKATPYLSIQHFGRSAQGRPLMVAIASRTRPPGPAAFRRTGKPVVLIQNGIHAGEIEGKDACLALLRDLTMGPRRAILDSLHLIVIVTINPDGHERRSPFHRANQDGPDSMGFRTNATRLNLNRDYTKLETPEIRAFLGLWKRWDPDLFVDTHTSDGADFRHDIMHGAMRGPDTPPSIARWHAATIDSAVVPALAAAGRLPSPYFEFTDWTDPFSGFTVGDAKPHFANGYIPWRNRPAILLEAHSLKPFETRVRATYDWLVALLEEVRRRPRALLAAGREAERWSASLRVGASVALSTVAGDSARWYPFKGYRAERESSAVLRIGYARFTREPLDTLIPYTVVKAGLTVPKPRGYVVPREWAEVRRILADHGIRIESLGRDWADTVEIYRFQGARFVQEAVEGHHPATPLGTARGREWRRFRAGDVYVPLDQPLARLAMALLEPEAPASLLAWNRFDAIFEAKEYAERYVVVPEAERMLANDPALRASWDAALRADTTLAQDPDARLEWFRSRSRWREEDQNVYPVARVTGDPPPLQRRPRPKIE